MSLLWKGDFDSFVDSLLIIKDQVEVQNQHVSDIRRHSFINTNPDYKPPPVNDYLNTELMGTVTSLHNRSRFLLKTSKKALMPKYTSPSKDVNVELAKGFAYNNGTPNPSLINNFEKSPIDNDRLVIMDQILQDGQLEGIIYAMETTGKVPREIVLKDNRIKDSQLAKILHATTNKLQSLVYSQKSNVIGKESFEVLKHLCVDNGLQSLKLIGSSVSDNDAFLDFLKHLVKNCKLRSLTLSSLYLS